MSKRRRTITVICVVVFSTLVSTALIGGASAKRGILNMLGISSTSQASTEIQREKGPRGPEANAPVENFGVIWDNKITRSGKPEDDAGWMWLRRKGVATIVNLRKDNTDVDYKKYGFDSFLWIPLSGGESPTDEKAEMFLRFIQHPDNQPVHVMCAEGKDRTGTMSALIRYSIDGWTMDEAIKEASLYRRGEDLSAARVEWLRQWATRHPPGSFRRPEQKGQGLPVR